MVTELARITDIAKAKPKERFTSLAHLIDETSLKVCSMEMDGKKATGIDRVDQGRVRREPGRQRGGLGGEDEEAGLQTPSGEASLHTEAGNEQAKAARGARL